ncbi:MBL fold metallo-hydrolase [Desulforamulus aquiferis]|uniref:beta-lactamase n=1 Tax=Desulforamulus aquiferis TaxID=1397668 RepID=A0AAW7ZC04_9FIRM|nr:MBL fold metallo-hydrolase [Desulforamulus aquiferis]MDO7787217.1 MBL fold metallo-hydrolase [Desulforamulus aquiferis]RYD02720.1 hypothetical protein N752_23355 [Desulforamulus aquiferis]
MSLTKLTDTVYVLQAPTNIGLIAAPDGQAVAIDSGIDDSIARKLLKEADKEGLQVKAIINTHSHADHIGGNHFIVGRTGAGVFTSALEAPYVEQPLYEPYTLTGGAYPWKELQNKFLLARASKVTEMLQPGEFSIHGLDLNIISLPGHSLGQIGVQADGVLFCGDSFISSNLLQKHGIPYNVNIHDYLETLDKLSKTNCNWYVPAHGTPSSNITEDLEVNRDKVLSLIQMVESLLSDPQEIDTLVSNICSALEVKAANTGIYYLYRTAVTAYLSYLYQLGRAKTEMDNNRLFWLTNKTG